MYRTWIEIDEQALVTNIKTLRSLSEGARFCAIVKANAYGHGLKEVAQIVSRVGVTAFGVDHIDDAILLRERFPSALIIVLGYTLFERFGDAVHHNIELTLYDKEGIAHAERMAASAATLLRVHLKLETGTTRQGVMSEDMLDLLLELKRCSHVQISGVSTHFANIEDTSDPQYASEQFSRFLAGIEQIRTEGFDPEHIHCACSAAVLVYPQTHQTLVRPGIALYGLWPSALVEQTVRKQNISCDLRPVLRWKTRIAQVKSVRTGTPVGYGLTVRMKQRSRVGILPVGYWDGYDRSLSGVGEVLVSGQRCPVLGRICMNMMMIDVSNVPKVEKEQPVTLIGVDGRHEISAAELAMKAQTIPYEIVSRINAILPRVVV
ncbi:alanine racemase [Candidatus Uhrbacteria bacterium]|nr:alanine racemase [Candidatus Uhrbacteria bacterium]